MGYEHEMVIPSEDFPFKLFEFEGKDGNYIREKHWHRSVEIFAVYEGSILFYLNEEKHLLKAGQFMLLNSNEIHSIDSPAPNHTVVLQIPLKTFREYYTGDQFIYFTQSPGETDEEVMRLIQEMYGGLTEKAAGYEYKILSEFYQLIYLLIVKYRRTEVSPEILKYYRKLNRLSLITEYIREHYREELSLDRLSEQFGYSPAYLSRMFRKYAQTNYKVYLQSIRIESAGRELLQTDHTVTEIAMHNGFPNSRSFSREFQKKYHMLPGEYRKKNSE